MVYCHTVPFRFDAIRRQAQSETKRETAAGVS